MNVSIEARVRATNIEGNMGRNLLTRRYENEIRKETPILLYCATKWFGIPQRNAYRAHISVFHHNFQSDLYQRWTKYPSFEAFLSCWEVGQINCSRVSCCEACQTSFSRVGLCRGHQASCKVDMFKNLADYRARGQLISEPDLEPLEFDSIFLFLFPLMILCQRCQ